MRDRLTTDKRKIFARECPTLMSMTKDELRMLYNEIFDRLQEYEVAEETGRIIVPPCKAGEMVYLIIESPKPQIEKKIVESIVIGTVDDKVTFTDGTCFTVWFKEWNLYHRAIFPTKEGAEKALSKLQASYEQVKGGAV